MKHKNTPIYQVLETLKIYEFTEKQTLNRLVWTSNVTWLIKSLKQQWHEIETLKDWLKVCWYKYKGYKMNFLTMAKDIKENHSRLEKLVRILYYITKI